MPSTFEENLSISEFPEIHEYPVATATHKAIQVYEKLVVSRLAVSSMLIFLSLFMEREAPDDAPDLVIAGANVFISKRVASNLDCIPYSRYRRLYACSTHHIGHGVLRATGY